jgi:hypothetical protein
MGAKERVCSGDGERLLVEVQCALPLHGAGNLLLKQSEERCRTCEDVPRFNEAAAAVVAAMLRSENNELKPRSWTQHSPATTGVASVSFRGASSMLCSCCLKRVRSALSRAATLASA